VAGDGSPGVVVTHRSTLFFYGDRVVKVRRPVAHGTADFRSPERRRASCEREVALNRSLAGDVYLGVATITMEGTSPEHAVVMRRLPAQRNLAVRLRRRRRIDGDLDQLAAALVRFHAGAERSPRIDAAATSAAVWQRWLAVDEAVGRFVGPLIDADRFRHMTALARRYVDGRGPLFQRRIAEGAVCDGHGTLRASDVFLLDDGPRILDRQDLDEEGRYGDVLVDVASLVQELELSGGPGTGEALLRAYRSRSAGEHPASLAHFYVAQQAHVRLLTDCLRQEQGLHAAQHPQALVDQAITHLQAALPLLVLVGGLPGTGRSTVAAWVGCRLDADVLAPRPLHHRSTATPTSGPGRQPQSSNERLCDHAGELLATGRSVVLDAAWSTAADRALAANVARRSLSQLVALRCECGREERALRVARRRSGRRPPVVLGPEAVEDPWPEALVVDTSSAWEPVQPATTVVPARPSRRSCARPNGPMAANPPVAST
jgi:uncharacterized protein